jgi:hypothetical protein
MGRPLAALLLTLALAAFSVMLFGRLSHPLLWQDEGETAMFGARILEYGFPKVHGERNVLYEFGPNVALGRKESVDAYIGKTWGDFYFAAPAVWWARRVEDPYAQTARLRAPFALVGALGLGAWLWGVWPLVPRARRLAFAAAFFGIVALSPSLLLHLREVRYYPLLVALLGLGVALHLRHLYGTLRGPAYVVGQALVSLALFQVFHVGWFAWTALLGVDLWLRWAGSGEPEERGARFVRAILPHGIGAVCVVPALVFFETFQIAAGFAGHLGVSAGGYGANVVQLLRHFATHELLLAVVASRLAVALWLRGEPVAPLRAVAARGALFCLGYAAVGCINPLVYERYFVVLSPVLTLVFLLDATLLLERASAPRRPAVAAAIALVGLLALSPHAGAVRGRLQELREPVRGPVDFLVGHLRERYPNPSQLVIATNYEAHPLMFYLGSHVIVGLSKNNIAADRQLVADVVVPRRRWPGGLPELRRFLAKGEYEDHALPVLDVHYNNTPSLTPSAATPDPHRFESPVASLADPGRLRVYHRVR